MKQNLHTHTLWCDGSNEAEEMIVKAIEKGFSSIGFSSHTFTGFSFDSCGLSTKEKEEEYISSLENLREKYRSEIEIFIGLEEESRKEGTLEPTINPRLDYSIGSVHWFWINGKPFSVDYTAEEFLSAQKEAGSLRALIEGYYGEVMRFASFSPYSITGHFDLVTKFVEKEGWSFEEEKWYRDISLSALDHVIAKGKVLEVNTGAISRGLRTSPYPSRFLLERAKEKNAPVVITTDCHNKDYLDLYFIEAKKILEAIGFKEIQILTRNGFKGEKL